MSSGQAMELFVSGSLRIERDAAAQAARDRLMGWNADALLNAAEADVVAELQEIAALEALALQRDGAYQEDPVDIAQEYPDITGRRIRANGTRFTLVIPFTGPAFFFNMAVLSQPTSPIYAQIDERLQTLRLHCDNLRDPAEIRAHFDQQLDEIERLLASIRADIQAHNQQMADQIPTWVAGRRAKLLEDRNLQASIGYPIRKRPDAATYSVPIKRVKIIPHRPARSNPYVPEPALAEADYEAALTVLRNARNALERSPTMSAKLDEEEIRDLLLVFLNAQFEGKAAGEVFNCTGKTDILIRDGDRNIFVGECKIFDLKYKKSVDSVVSSALDQLLGYLVWRDTKAALLLFIRDANVSAIVEKALTTITSHPSHKRPGKITTEERHDFVLHARGDTSREIHLAFLPFLIGGGKA